MILTQQKAHIRYADSGYETGKDIGLGDEKVLVQIHDDEPNYLDDEEPVEDQEAVRTAE